MPSGPAKHQLGEAIERQTEQMLDERTELSVMERAWRVASMWVASGWVLLLAHSVMTGDETWTTGVETLALFLGCGFIMLGLGLMLLLVGLVLRRGARWLRSRRRRVPADPDQAEVSTPTAARPLSPPEPTPSPTP